MRLKPIAQQVVVVFGASSGIGRATALRLAERGAKVVVSARSVDGLETLVGEIRSRGGEATSIPADVTDFEQVRAVAAGAVERYGHLDTWVHAAAVTVYATFEETTPEEFRRLLDVNLIGQVHGAKAALPYLRRSGGALILISSVEAMRALPYNSAYAASKHGIHGFVQALRVELAHEKAPVVVTEVMPGTINTPLFNKGRSKLGVKPVGIPPVYPPELVAEAVLHCAEHPTRDFVVGGAAQMLVNGERLSPRLMDAMMLATGFGMQKTDDPKSPDAPDNLYAPVGGYDRVQGDFARQANLMRCSTWFQRDGLLLSLLGSVALGAAAAMAMQKRQTAPPARSASPSRSPSTFQGEPISSPRTAGWGIGDGG